MSALRFSRPGVVGTTLVDLGPSHVTSLRLGIYLLSEAVPTRTLAPGQPERAGRNIVRRPYEGERCGYLLPALGEPCFRRPHESRDHRSEASVKADRARRESRARR